MKELVYQAQEAVVKGEYEQAQKILTAIKIAVFQSADLSKADKREMVVKIEHELTAMGIGVNQRYCHKTLVVRHYAALVTSCR
jgi:hypothetical protein